MSKNSSRQRRMEMWKRENDECKDAEVRRAEKGVLLKWDYILRCSHLAARQCWSAPPKLISKSQWAALKSSLQPLPTTDAYTYNMLKGTTAYAGQSICRYWRPSCQRRFPANILQFANSYICWKPPLASSAIIRFSLSVNIECLQRPKYHSCLSDESQIDSQQAHISKESPVLGRMVSVDEIACCGKDWKIVRQDPCLKCTSDESHKNAWHDRFERNSFLRIPYASRSPWISSAYEASHWLLSVTVFYNNIVKKQLHNQSRMATSLAGSVYSDWKPFLILIQTAA